MSTAEDRLSGNIQSLEKGLRILDELIDAPAPLRLADITKRFDMDRASAFRFLQTLESNGYVRKDTEKKEYDVGGRVYFWASRLRQKTRLIESFHDHLQRLASLTRQTAHLGLFVIDRVLLADYAFSDSIIAIRHRIGMLEPLYCTAVGKAVLAHVAEPRREELLRKIEFVRLTEKTIMDRDTLRKDLDLARQRGYALDENESHKELTCIACPILDGSGQPFASIGITAITALLNAEPGRMDDVVRAVMIAGEEVNRQTQRR